MLSAVDDVADCLGAPSLIGERKVLNFDVGPDRGQFDPQSQRIAESAVGVGEAEEEVRVHVAPAGDPVEDLWRRYYASIFNPARLKVGAML